MLKAGSVKNGWFSERASFSNALPERTSASRQALRYDRRDAHVVRVGFLKVGTGGLAELARSRRASNSFPGSCPSDGMRKIS